MYKCLLKQVKDDSYDPNYFDLASYITMARKIIEEHETSLMCEKQRATKLKCL